MNFNTFIWIFFIAIGTFLSRYLPLKTSLLRADKKNNAKDIWSQLFEVSGISIIASLLIISLSSQQNGENPLYSINVLISSLIVIGTCLLWKNPGASVIAGIVSFGIINFVAF